MNTILTDDERPKLPETHYQLYYEWPDDEDGHGGSEVVDGDAYTAKQMEAYADAREAAVLAKLAQQADRQRVPEGWKLVPVDPTERMCKAAADAWLDCHSKMVLNKAGAAAKAAIAAATEAPAQASAVDERAAFLEWQQSAGCSLDAVLAEDVAWESWQARAALAQKVQA